MDSSIKFEDMTDMRIQFPEPLPERPGEHTATRLTYVLITPARNEAAFIEQTINSVLAQTVRPLKWVIVSDGSTDGTDEIVAKNAADYHWIELVRLPERRERHFAGKVHAFNAGYSKVADFDYDVIGNLDADITFDEKYFEFLLEKFAANPKLGVAGTPFREDSSQYDYRFTSIEHVSGACQLFRRDCFKEVGGYIPIKIGGIDLTAVLTARMKGWQTRSFPEKTCIHHRQMGTAKQNALMVAFRGGKGDYMLGSHPLWEFSRCIYQLSRRPVLLGGMFRLAGFTIAMVKRAEKLVPTDLVQFRRTEQMRRLRGFLKNINLGKIVAPGPQRPSAIKLRTSR
jgi:poly-beta-1,6-N-acetyl-D-glucosamine synthase